MFYWNGQRAKESSLYRGNLLLESSLSEVSHAHLVLLCCMVVLKWCMGRLLAHSLLKLQILFLATQHTNYTRLTMPGILLHTKILRKCIYSGTSNSELYCIMSNTIGNGYNTPVYIKVIHFCYTHGYSSDFILLMYTSVYIFCKMYYWSTVHYLTPGVHHTMCTRYVAGIQSTNS